MGINGTHGNAIPEDQPIFKKVAPEPYRRLGNRSTDHTVDPFIKNIEISSTISISEVADFSIFQNRDCGGFNI